MFLIRNNKFSFKKDMCCGSINDCNGSKKFIITIKKHNRSIVIIVKNLNLFFKNIENLFIYCIDSYSPVILFLQVASDI